MKSKLLVLLFCDATAVWAQSSTSSNGSTSSTLNATITAASNSSATSFPYTATSFHGTLPTSLSLSPTNSTSSFLSVGNFSSTTASNVSTTATATVISGTKSIVTTVPTAIYAQCNGHVAFCTRKYSNITFLGAHDSPNVRANSAAANQNVGVVQQLEDGLRFMELQVHWTNNQLRLCHTSCELLDDGTLEEYLAQVAGWMRDHPFEVVTLLAVNYNGNPNVFQPWKDAVDNSGISRFLYSPPKPSLTLDEWPTLQDLIYNQTRLVFFISTGSNYAYAPYLIDEFPSVFETPFEQTDAAFPCNLQRLQGTSPNGKLMLVNHYLVANITISGQTLFIPNVADLNQTNGQSGYGSVGAQIQTCFDDHQRNPNFIILDFYDQGGLGGFKAVAAANHVPYSGDCCTAASTGGGSHLGPNRLFWIAMIGVLGVICLNHHV